MTPPDVDALVERLKRGFGTASGVNATLNAYAAITQEAAAALLALRDDVAKWQGIAAREASHGAEVWAERDALRAELDALLKTALDLSDQASVHVQMWHDPVQCEALRKAREAFLLCLSPAEQPKEASRE